jgi:hypothetical protein
VNHVSAGEAADLVATLRESDVVEHGVDVGQPRVNVSRMTSFGLGVLDEARCRRARRASALSVKVLVYP